MHIVRLLGTVVLAGTLLSCNSADRGRDSIANRALDPAEMKKEIAAALGTSDVLDRLASMTRLMQGVDSANLEAAVAAFEENAGRADAVDVRLLANAWSRIDAKGALEHFLGWENRAIARSAIAEVIHRWTRMGDPKEVSQFVSTLLDRVDVRDEPLRNVILGASATGLIARREHEAVTSLLGGIESDEQRDWVLSQVVIELLRMGQPELRAWVDSIPWEAPHGLKRQALTMGMSTIARIDGAPVAAWYGAVRDRLEPGEMLEPIAVSWSAHRPVETAEWLLTQPESEGRQRALRATAFTFLKADGPAAAEWIEKHEGNPAVKAAMLFPATQYMMSVDIQRALLMAERLDDRLLKIAALKQVLMIWSRTDYPAVEKYMVEVGVPPEVEDTVRGQNAIRVEREAGDAKSTGPIQ